MTTREVIRLKIDQLDDERAKAILDHIEDLLDETKRGATLPSDERDRSTQRDARLSLIGMARSALPTNIAERKDEYIASAILQRDAIEP